ncbi:hypothetical protein [Pseudofrankia sp. BMG5.37]|uniref:hypothetical protein n=1 Tax=Pseudofrankia sp. BMG5.37 TaxID=3050035 RepID=UPI002893B685|nr:hypothetical protein [Pseudofrankia sp. BMG5.37]MDT3443822.1 hypothetical protein [Pseudofrankia sp. BMG5.37]
MYVNPVLGQVLLVALCAAISVVVGLVAGILTSLTGETVPAAILAGGAAAAGTLALGLAVATFIRGA